MKVVILTICALIFSSNTIADNLNNVEPFTGYAENLGDTVNQSLEEDKTPPNPYTTFLIAFFPGFFIHGLGHFYVGDNFTGGMILGSEILGAALFFPLVLSCWDKDFCPETILWNLLVLGPWIYDCIAAPLKAKRLSERYKSIKKEKISFQLGVMPPIIGKSGGIVFNVKF